MTKTEQQALAALIRWRKDWENYQEEGPTENTGFSKIEIRLFKIAGKLIGERTTSGKDKSQ